jgi:hypothetical protein
LARQEQSRQLDVCGIAIRTQCFKRIVLLNLSARRQGAALRTHSLNLTAQSDFLFEQRIARGAIGGIFLGKMQVLQGRRSRRIGCRVSHDSPRC